MKRPTFALRNVAVILVVGPLLVAAILLGGVGRQLMHDVVERFHTKFVSNIFVSAAKAVEAHVGDGVRLLHEAVARAEATPELLEDSDALGRYFAERIRLARSVEWVSFSRAHDGRFVGARRDGRGQVVINHSHPLEHDGIPQEWLIGVDGSKTELDTAALAAYDPREREWFAQALATNRAIWTPPYTFHEGPLGVTCARACRDASGRELGVLTVDLLVEDIVAFLEKLQVGTTGFVFLYNDSGTFLAPRHLAPQQLATLRAAMTTPYPTVESDPNLGIPLEQDGETYLVARRELGIHNRSGWWCGILVPQNEIWGALAKVMLWNGLIALGLISMAVLIATLVAAGASRSLERLRRDLGQVGRGLSEPIPEGQRSCVREIAALQASVAEMARLVKQRQETERARLLAESCSRAKSDAMAMVSHDLRSPLQSVVGYTELLLLNPDGPVAERVAALESIDTGCRVMVQLVGNYLNLLSLSEGKLTVQKGVVELETLCQECVALAHGMANGKGITINAEFQGAGSMETDREKLRQILLNLLGNAVKFAPGGVVTFRVERRAEELVFSIADTGIGMSPEQSRIVFDAFTQADPTIAAKYGGTGLGLTITKRLTELLGGRIALESMLGNGTCVTLNFPLKFTPPSSEPTALGLV